MKTLVALLIAFASALACDGCAGSRRGSASVEPETSNSTEVIARVEGITITRKQLEDPLIASHGLNMLINLAQLELTRKLSADENVSISPADIDTEFQITLNRMFDSSAEKTDFDGLFKQYLAQQRISREEFMIVVETNAILRKLAQPSVVGKINEDGVKQAFAALYGERVQVRHIQCSNIDEINEARRRLAAGASFQQVAMDLSRNRRTAVLGGEMPPFSRSAVDVPQVLKDTAFALKDGEVSDPIALLGAYHLVRLDRRIPPPKAVKYEDYKEIVRRQLEEQLLQARVTELRAQISSRVVREINIDHPVLHEQFEARAKQQETSIKDRDKIRQELVKQREIDMTTQPTTAPATATKPAGTPPATAPASATAPTGHQKP